MIRKTLVIAAVLFIIAVPLRADDAVQLDRFLARLGLVDLQILNLEQSLAKQGDAAAQLPLARQLADLYAARLMEVGDDATRYAELLARIEKLTQRFPQANTTALEVMLLQADYNRAETLVGEWIADSKKSASRQSAGEILSRIAPQLQQHQSELNARADKLLADIDKLEEGEERQAKEAELARVSPVAGRATYFAGWAAYYLGLARPDRTAAGKDFEQARSVFRKLLGLTDEDTEYAKVDVAWLGLESIWRTRAVIGLGLAEAATGRLPESEAVFAWLESPIVAAQVRDQAAFWFLQGLLNAGKPAAARDYAAKQVAAFAGEVSQGKVSLCVALVRAGFGSGAADADRRELGLLGISGLAKLKQFAALRTLVDEYEIDLGDGGGFYVAFVQGQQQFDAAEKSKDPEQYRAAIKQFIAALATSDAKNDAATAGLCRYNLAWSHYRLEDFAAAAREFEQAIPGLKLNDRETAAQSAWLAFGAHRQLIGKSPTAASAAISALERLKREFPESKFAPRVDFQMAKLQSAASSPEESIAALQKIKPGEANYLAARYDLGQLLHSQWRAARDDAAKAKVALAELQQAVDVFIAAAGADDGTRKVTLLLKVVDAALGSNPAASQLATNYLQRASAIVDGLPDDDVAAAEFHYQALQHARAAGDTTARQLHAQWLVEHAKGSSYELPALVTTASALDAEVKSAPKSQLPDLEEQAYDVYHRLARALGDSPNLLEQQKNARVAQAKLAYYAAQTGRHEEAAAGYAKLLAVFPKDKDYLRRAGMATFAAGAYDASLAHWTTLLRGLAAGSDDWLEAKYHQIACLAAINKTEAAQVMQQFVLLYPNFGGGSWGAKFRTLAASLK